MRIENRCKAELVEICRNNRNLVEIVEICSLPCEEK